jgi:hypothetical protein
MAITLRTVTGSALSHEQLDTNFSSYFYSASVSGSTLNLHYTGSATIGLFPRSSSISLPSSSKWTETSGGGIARNSEVQITGSTYISGSTNIVGNFVQGFTGGQASNFSHAEGYFAIASGSYSHAEGYQTTTSGSYSHAEGRETVTKAIGSHAEGYQTVASGSYSHAEGNTSIAIGIGSHAEGYATTATGDYSHAEGSTTIASGAYSHAEGRDTLTLAQFSHAEGYGTVAAGRHQHVQGQYNLTSSAESAFIIGNGVSDGARRNLVFASGSQFDVTGSLNVSGAINTLGNLTVQGNITAQQYIVSTSVYFVTESFFSGSHIFGNSQDDTHQFTGSILLTGSALLTGSSLLNWGSSTASTSSFSAFIDDSGRFQLGNSRLNTFGVYGLKMNNESKVQLSTTQRNYALYDTTLNIVGSGSNDGITMIQHPDTSNKYTITVQSGSQYKLNFKNSLHPDSGSFDFSGSVAIKNDLYVGGNKMYNYGAFYHTGSDSLTSGTPFTQSFSSTFEASGVSVTGAANTRITIANSGTYNVAFSIQVQQTTADRELDIWFKKNGTAIPNSNTKGSTRNGDYQVFAWNFVTTLAAGDYVELLYQSNGTGTTVPYIAGSGQVPATPSVIITVTQVR